MKMGGFFIGVEAALLNAVTLGRERYDLVTTPVLVRGLQSN